MFTDSDKQEVFDFFQEETPVIEYNCCDVCLDSKSILVEAEDIVNGREQATNRKYGKPSKVFKKYADIFKLIAPPEAYDKMGNLTALGIAYVLKSIKLGRETVSHKRDNLVDDCGYTEIIAQIREDR